MCRPDLFAPSSVRSLSLFFFFSLLPRPPRSTLFPYTTLFRSLDIELPVDCTRAATSDEVAATLDYKRVAKRVLAYVAASEFKLVETLAHRVALLILEEFAVDWVRISLNKPGAVRHSRDVGVVIERTRADLASAAPPPADRT